MSQGGDIRLNRKYSIDSPSRWPGKTSGVLVNAPVVTDEADDFPGSFFSLAVLSVEVDYGSQKLRLPCIAMSLLRRHWRIDASEEGHVNALEAPEIVGEPLYPILLASTFD